MLAGLRPVSMNEDINEGREISMSLAVEQIDADRRYWDPKIETQSRQSWDELKFYLFKKQFFRECICNL